MKVTTDSVLIGAWAEGGCNILDIGTGTGVVALMLAQRYTEAIIDAVEKEPDACHQAADNFTASPFGNRISLIESSFQDFAANTEKRYDAIVCNPPYFANSLKSPDSKRSTARHSDALPFNKLIYGCQRLISTAGKLSLVIPIDAFESIDVEASACGFYLLEQVSIATKVSKPPTRLLLKYGKQRSTVRPATQISITNEQGKPSAWYQQLTRDFLLK